MTNKTSAQQWIELSKRHLETAELLINAKHYNDIIGIELHFSLELCLKAVSAFNNKAVIKTHDLMVLLSAAEEYLRFEENIKDIIDIATNYYVDNKYPGGGINFLPTDDEIRSVKETAEYIFNEVINYINR